MDTIVKAQQHIAVLWSNSDIKNNEMLRLMRYVMRVDYEDVVLLHNLVTGQLVALDQEESQLLSKLPTTYSPTMNQMIEGHYIVPDWFDEHHQVANMRKILWKLKEAQREPGIFRYTILPTTSCNARCYYCFEQGVRHITMTEQTATDVVEFISAHHEGKKVWLSWFGGEPTVAAKRIDQICSGLKNRGIEFSSEMTTNGYLLDEKMIHQAKSLWNLESVMICVDGTEDNYNKIKSFVYSDGSAYQRVMHNVEVLADRGIRVDLRMNFDLNNYQDFPELLKDVLQRFGGNQNIKFRVHPIIGEYVDSTGSVQHGSDEWYAEKVFEFDSLARNAGLLKGYGELPSLHYSGCQANSDSTVTITADGRLVRCPEQFGDNQTTGTLREGITNNKRVLSWKEFADYPKCQQCVLYPKCNRIVNCSVKERCNYFVEESYLIRESIKHNYTEQINFC